METEYLTSLFLLTARHAAVLMLVPAFSMRALPVPVRLALALLITVAILPPGAAVTNPVPADATFFIALLREILVGALAGFGVLLIFSAFQGAGSLIGMQIGLGMANVVNPTFPSQDTTLSSFYNFVAGFVFFAINGHHQVIAGMDALARAVPVDTFVISGATMEAFLTLVALMFGAAARVAFPVLTALLLADVALGIMSRLAPQMQVFYVGMPAKTGLGLLMLVLVFPGTVATMVGMFDSMMRSVLLLFARV